MWLSWFETLMRIKPQTTIFIFDVFVPILGAQIMFMLLERGFYLKSRSVIRWVLQHGLLRGIFTYCVVFMFHFILQHYLELSFIFMLILFVFIGVIVSQTKGEGADENH